MTNQSINLKSICTLWVWWKSVGSLKSLGYCPRKSRLIPAVMLPETWNSQNYTFYRVLHFFSIDNVKRKMLLPNLSSICALAIKSFIIRSCSRLSWATRPFAPTNNTDADWCAVNALPSDGFGHYCGALFFSFDKAGVKTSSASLLIFIKSSVFCRVKYTFPGSFHRHTYFNRTRGVQLFAHFSLVLLESPTQVIGFWNAHWHLFLIHVRHTYSHQQSFLNWFPAQTHLECLQSLLVRARSR